MGALGFGVGMFSAAMPGVILAVTPPGETSSAMSFNQVVRSVGFSLGSALSGFILAAYTPRGRAFPAAAGYSAAAWAGVAAMTVTLAVIAGLAGALRAEIGRKAEGTAGLAMAGGGRSARRLGRAAKPPVRPVRRTAALSRSAAGDRRSAAAAPRDRPAGSYG